MASDHVPAWKRLGLKLKYASETTSASIEEPNGHDGGQKRKSTLKSNETTSEPPAKRLRVDINHQKKDIVTETPNTTPSRQNVTPNGKSKAEATRRKSVAFAADTKGEDDESVQKTLTSAIGSPGSTPKKPKRDKRTKNEKQPSTTHATFEKKSPTLEYLHEYAYARDSWKFNKNREVKVLKQIFSSSDIPNSYQPALASYIYGLKSSGAKQRLIKDCQEQSAKDESLTTSTTVASQNDMFKAQFLENLKQDNLIPAINDDHRYQTWIENEPRSKLLLMVLVQTTTIPQPRPSPVTLNSQANGPKVKKSKARTSRVEIESDSDSSSSDSDSDSDNGSDRMVNPKKVEAEVDTSSSGSSSSDSEADSISSSEASESNADSSSDADTSSEAGKPPTTNGVHNESSSDSDSD